MVSLLDRDPVFKVDRLGSVLLDYDGIQASFVYSTQLPGYQRMQFLGTKGRIEVEIPFNAPNDRPCRLLLDDGSSPFGDGIKPIEIPVCDQYGLAAAAFAEAILDKARAAGAAGEHPGQHAGDRRRLPLRHTGRWETP